MRQKGEPSAVKSDFKHPAASAKGPEKKAEAFSAKELIEETHRVGPSLLGSDKKGNRPFEGRMMPNELINPVAANELLQWEIDLNAFVGRQPSIVTVNGGCSPGVIVEVEKPAPERVVVDWYTFFQASRFNVRIADTAITRWVYGRDLIGPEHAPGHSCKPVPRGK